MMTYRSGDGTLDAMIRIVAILVACCIAMGIVALASATAIGQEAESVQEATTTTLVIHYQGQLLDPVTLEPKPDGAYAMTFKLYPSAAGGTPFWTETKTVAVSIGLFSTLLGDTTPLDAAQFSGQDLWLGVTVGNDAEATPRTPITFAPYAIRALQSTAAVNADKLDGQHAGAFAAASHSHDAGAITSGTLADSRVAANITRDNEVMTIVKANDGSGSTLDADTVDGLQAGAFATASHNHLGQTWTGSGDPLQINDATVVVDTDYGDGFRVDSATDDGLQVTSAMWGLYVSSAQIHGILISGAGQSALYATTNSASDTVYLRNSGAGKGISAYSYSGVGGHFSTYGNLDILLAEEEVTAGNFDIRFRVKRWGDVLADGSFTGGGADFAEMLPAVAGLTPGDVLVIGPDGRLAASSAPNAGNLAGVYSTQPGFVGGIDGPAEASMSPSKAMVAQAAAAPGLQDKVDPVGDGAIAGSTGHADAAAQATVQNRATAMVEATEKYARVYGATGKLPLAVVGVVPVKVSAENGPILPGDLLTSSSTPGHAMKATPVDVGGVAIYRTGTILGKALEAHQSGTGTIDVLVTLQ